MKPTLLKKPLERRIIIPDGPTAGAYVIRIDPAGEFTFRKLRGHKRLVLSIAAAMDEARSVSVGQKKLFAAGGAA